MMFGIHAARTGGVSALMAKVDETVCNMMYPKLKASPMPRNMPMPPLRLRDDNDNPMVVRMNEAKEVAMRL